MSRRMKKYNQAKNIFERMDVSRGDLPDFLRNYWVYQWIIPWLLLLALTLAGYLKIIMLFTWPLVSISMITARYFDIFNYKGTTLSGYPAGASTFFHYVFIALIPTIIGELISYYHL